MERLKVIRGGGSDSTPALSHIWLPPSQPHLGIPRTHVEVDGAFTGWGESVLSSEWAQQLGFFGGALSTVSVRQQLGKFGEELSADCVWQQQHALPAGVPQDAQRGAGATG